MLIERIFWLGHSSFRVESKSGTTIYFDPFRLPVNSIAADIICISHAHADHCSENDIARIYRQGTIIIGPDALFAKITFPARAVRTGDRLYIKGIGIEAVAAYNINKHFHPQAAGNLGFIAEIDGERLYFAGDTDLIPEMSEIRADIALLPVGGVYTMNAEEAAEAARRVQAKMAVPMHYATVVGSEKDAELFRQRCPVPVKIMEAIR